MISFARDELGIPNLDYLTRVRFIDSAIEHGPRTLALTVGGHLRYLLAPTDIRGHVRARDIRATA